jgi:hypothetical protein
VSDEVYVPGKAQIAHEILAYLDNHPDAQDTVDGIVDWWLLERKIIYQRKIVQEALAELIDKELILEVPGGDSRIHYRVNHRRIEKIRVLLGQARE